MIGSLRPGAAIKSRPEAVNKAKMRAFRDNDKEEKHQSQRSCVQWKVLRQANQSSSLDNHPHGLDQKRLSNSVFYLEYGETAPIRKPRRNECAASDHVWCIHSSIGFTGGHSKIHGVVSVSNDQGNENMTTSSKCDILDELDICFTGVVP